MKTPLLAAVLIAVAAPALAQSPAEHEQHHPGGTSVSQAQSTPPAQPQPPPAPDDTTGRLGKVPCRNRRAAVVRRRRLPTGHSRLKA